jgi:hemerythrin-like domain-containing protein
MSNPGTDGAVTQPPRGRFTIVYLIHEAFRRDLGRLSAALRKPPVDAARARQLRAHWDFMAEQLHHHHQVEDDALWPLVRPKLAGRDEDLAVLDEMVAQHLALSPTTEAVETGFVALSENPTDGAAAALADRIDALAVALGAHLDAEETRCFPVVDAALSLEEFESFGKATAKAVGMRGSARFFPWIFDGADPVERGAVLTMPPPPVRILCQRVWEPRYQRRSAILWAG